MQIDYKNELRYWREQGFPNYRKRDYHITKEIAKVRLANTFVYFDGKTFGKYQSANGFLFSYFPHWIEVRCGKSESVKEAWEDDRKLLSLIKKTHAYCEKHGEEWSTNRFRQNAKVYLAKQSVSNFNPITARILYDIYAPNGVVYDMSMGWGGRLMGFHASQAHTYIGCEPSTKTLEGLKELNKDLSRWTRNKQVIMLPCGSENADLTEWKEKVDIAFTSPPYFDTEKYSDEPTQSYIAFPTKQEWLNGFLKATMEKAYQAIKPSGVLAINYMDDKETIAFIKRTASELGLTLERELKYEMSSISGKGRKYEPILVFRKQGATKGHDYSPFTLF